MTYIGQGPGLAKKLDFSFIATAGQTAFSGMDINNITLTYTPRLINVVVNGVRLGRNDYTATDGSTITIGYTLSAGDSVEIEAFGAFSPADTYTRAEIDALTAP